ncbi:MAG: O-antigen ligase family protein [Chloroflexi bacterium]|nr:O-antigen ligase family protein [Chloroflexota bacterium]
MTAPAGYLIWPYRLLLGSLWLLPLTLPHRANYMLWQVAAPPHTNLWYEFRAITAYLFDIPLLIFLFCSVMLLISDEWRRKWCSTLWAVVRYHGGLWWGLLLLWIGLSLIWSMQPDITLYRIVRTWFGVYLALWLALLIHRGQAVSLLRSFVFASALHSSVALLQALFRAPLGWTWLGEYQPPPANPWGFGPQEFQGFGLTIHPNNLASYLLVGLFAALVLIRHNWLRIGWMAWLENGALVLIIAGLLATASRTAIIAAVLGCLLSVILSPPRLFQNRRTLTVAVIVLMLFGLLLALQTNLLSRFVILLQQDFTSRLTFAFADTVAVTRQHPLLGVGHGNLLIAIGQLRAGSPDILLPAHNVLYLVRAELGLVGVFLLVMCLLTVLLRLRRDSPGGVMLWGSCLAALSIIMLLDFYLWSEVRSHLLFWYVIGMWWGYNTLHQIATPTNRTIH